LALHSTATHQYHAVVTQETHTSFNAVAVYHMVFIADMIHMRHRLKWFIRLRAHSLDREMEYGPFTLPYMIRDQRLIADACSPSLCCPGINSRNVLDFSAVIKKTKKQLRLAVIIVGGNVDPQKQQHETR